MTIMKWREPWDRGDTTYMQIVNRSGLAEEMIEERGSRVGE